jgi:AcrR family transcriptional regulator
MATAAVTGDAVGALRRRGRPRSTRARAAILAAAGELMLEGGMAAASMEAIAQRAGVSKATIYRWWPSRGAVALEGFLEQTRDTIEIPEGLSTHDALRFQVGALIELFRDPTCGPLMRALIGQAQSDAEIARALRERWLAPRRAVAAEAIHSGIERGEIRRDIDVAVVVDQIFAPVYHRLALGHDGLDDGLADRLVGQLMAGLRPDAMLNATSAK